MPRNKILDFSGVSSESKFVKWSKMIKFWPFFHDFGALWHLEGRKGGLKGGQKGGPDTTSGPSKSNRGSPVSFFKMRVWNLVIFGHSDPFWGVFDPWGVSYPLFVEEVLITFWPFLGWVWDPLRCSVSAVLTIWEGSFLIVFGVVFGPFLGVKNGVSW